MSAHSIHDAPNEHGKAYSIAVTAAYAVAFGAVFLIAVGYVTSLVYG